MGIAADMGKAANGVGGRTWERQNGNAKHGKNCAEHGKGRIKEEEMRNEADEDWQHIERERTRRNRERIEPMRDEADEDWQRIPPSLISRLSEMPTMPTRPAPSPG